MILKDECKTILVIVPHQDDEVNLMGGLIPLLHQVGCEMHILFLTNGDALFDGKVRMREAVNALRVLNVDDKNIHFLGYPDASNIIDHSIYQSEDIVKTRCGFSTYGIGEINDYAFQIHGVHSLYTYSNLKKDLKECMLRINPEVIFATDMDSHHDHRLCSLAFEDVLSEILCDPGLEFCPYVYKGFAYSTAYGAENDFYRINIKDTLKPNSKNLARNTISELDNPVFSWESRIQFPVSESATVETLHNNVVYRSLKEHISQCISLRSKNIINADKCFWERPTVNLIYQAQIVVSSGDVKNLLDWRLFDVKDIGEQVIPLKYKYIGWTPDYGDFDKTINIQFKNTVNVKKVNFYIITLENDVEPLITVNFNGDIVLKIADFKEFNKKYEYVFPEAICTESVLVKVNSEYTSLLYIEILPEDIEPFKFAKIKLNGNFSYNYYLERNQTELSYIIYSYGIYSEELKLVCDNTNVNITEEVCVIPENLKQFKLSVIGIETGIIYDAVSITRLRFGEKIFKKFFVQLDKLYVGIIHKSQKFKRHILKCNY